MRESGTTKVNSAAKVPCQLTGAVAAISSVPTVAKQTCGLQSVAVGSSSSPHAVKKIKRRAKSVNCLFIEVFIILSKLTAILLKEHPHQAGFDHPY
jgi:hypothetical protein